MHLGLLATVLKIAHLFLNLLIKGSSPDFSSCISHLGLLCPFAFLLFSRILPVLTVIVELYLLMPSWFIKVLTDFA